MDADERAAVESVERGEGRARPFGEDRGALRRRFGARRERVVAGAGEIAPPHDGASGERAADRRTDRGHGSDRWMPRHGSNPLSRAVRLDAHETT